MSLDTPAARRDLAFHLHPSTNLRLVQNEGPLVITRGEGVYVFDDECRRYLEGMSGLWCASLGFSEKRLAEAPAVSVPTITMEGDANGAPHPEPAA